MKMVRTGKFGPAEAVVLLTLSSMARIFLTFPRFLVEIAGEAAWLSSLAGLAMVLFQVYVFLLLLRTHPQKNIVDITAEALGRVAGTAANIVYAAFFVAVAAMFTRTFSEALLVSALPRTPISVVSTGYVAMGVLGAYVGLEAMARSARVVYPFVVAGIAILLLALIPLWDYTQLFPPLGQGPLSILRGGLIAGAVVEVLLAAVIVQSFHDPDKFGTILSWAMLMGFGYMIALMLILVMTFGYNTAQELTLPFYQVSRLIYLGRYFQRVESIFIIIWGYIGMVKVVLTLYAAAVTFAGTFKLPDYRPLIWPLALIIFVASLLPGDMPAAERIEAVVLRYYAWFPAFVLPLAVLAAGRARNRRNRKNAGG